MRQSTTQIFEMLTVKETAELLRVSEQTIQNLFTRKLLTRRKVGRRTLVERAEVVKYLGLANGNAR
jgi:excisionase family DNA binding protein